MKKRVRALALAACCTLGLTGCGSDKLDTTPAGDTTPGASGTVAEEVNYPDGNTLNMIIPVKAGGNMDILGRIVADYMGDIMGANVVVTNQAGSGGVVAATQYLAEQPNTDTIIYFPANIFTVSPLYSELEYTIDDFTPIAAYNSEANGVFALANGPIQSFDDLKAWDPNDTLLFGSGGQGVANYLMQAALYKDLGLTAETIPHDAASEGLVNVIAGTTDVCLASMTLAEQYVKDGSLIPLFTYEKEDYTYADGTVVPSLYTLTGKDYDIPSLQFFAIRAGTDQAIVDYLYDVLQQVYADPDFQEEYVSAGGNVDNLTGLATTPSADVKAMIEGNISVAEELYNIANG